MSPKQPKPKFPIKPKSPEGSPAWIPLSAFMLLEGLSADDLVRLIALEIAPRMDTVAESVWVHAPTLADWRMLAGTKNFKTMRQAMAVAKTSSATVSDATKSEAA
jgi:hypothetical protein